MTEHTEQAPQTPTPKMKKSKWRRRLCAVSAVVFFAVFALLGMLATENGQHKLIQWADDFTDALSIKRIEGNLSEGLVLTDVRFQTQGIGVQVNQARLQMQLSCLWKLKVCVDDISLQQPGIQIDTALLPPSGQKPKESAPMKRISLPISVQVNQLAVKDLSLLIDKNQMHLATFHTAAGLNNETGITLSPTQIDDFRFVQQLTENTPQEAEVKPAGSTASPPINWEKLEQDLSRPLLADLPKIDLPFDMHVQGISGKNWQYQLINDKQETLQDILVSSVELQADATDYTVQLQKFDVKSSLGHLTASGQMQLSEDFPLQFKLLGGFNTFKHNNNVSLPASKIDLTLSGSLKKQTALSLQTQGALETTLEAQAQPAAPKLPLTLHFTADKAQYPFNNKDPLQINDLVLDIEGDLLTAQVNLKSAVSGMGIPTNTLKLQAVSHLSNVEIQRLLLNALSGSAELQGNLNWRDGIAWDSHLQLAKINVGKYLSSFPAQLSGKLSSQGKANQSGWQVAVPELDIQGTLSQHPLNLKGNFTAGNQQLLNIPQLLLTYGDNKIEVQGHLGDTSDFNLDINAPNLQGLWADLSAGLKGNVKLNGSIARPSIHADLTASRFAFQHMRLNQALIKGEINSAEQISGQLEVNLNGFNYNDIKVNQLKLTANGDEQKHSLQLQSDGTPVATNLNFTGNFDRTLQQWKGTLSQMMIKSEFGNLQTNQNVAVTYNNKTTEATISAHCWIHSHADLCFPQSFNVGANGEVPFDIKRFNLAFINKLLEQELLSGQLNSQGKVAWFTDKPLQAELQLNGNHVSLTQKVDRKTFRLAIPQIDLNANLANNNLALKSDIHLQDQGRIGADLKLSDIANARKLGGTFSIQNLNLNLANQLLNRDEQVNGALRANLSLGGSLTAPNLNGEVNLNKLTAKIRALPFDITESELTLRFTGTNSTLQGYVQTADSRLHLSGEANWKNVNDWRTRLHAEADKFKVDIPSMARLRISPNIDISATPKLLELSGNIDIPWARIAIENLPDSAVAVSSDEVILNGNKKSTLPKTLPSETQSSMAIRSDLRINIGDDVSLNAYGLKTHLHGLLSVKQEKGNLGLYGEVNLKNGRYASFGQDLIIRKGLISFVGQPSQPMLNIEAIRNPEAMEDASVTAGVKVNGIATAPSVTIFSEPGMPQDQALSYILTGRSLENSGDTASSGSVGAALLGMGLAKSGNVVGGIGKAFGIKDLNLSTAGVGDRSKVVVSGTITPRLQVKYGVGLFDGLAEVTLRYRLLPQLYVQSVSGVNQAFDLLYQFEF
ncbi:tubulin-binding protein [Aggregatibacter actinomycetemcomitans]|uniref:Tubulin-binding protein n=1 Tax=Aggregatibacter actinomycetemcomitans TaxID=714 RepID=A0AAC8XY41_AGGAC|nr:translocation/assembly module TamB domain-containing protein [Aggregatibacter actinomycetemcomitans]AMQ93916.1 tubulin-binding protein [Aggregatibacter actinomycetemcomitans]